MARFIYYETNGKPERLINIDHISYIERKGKEKTAIFFDDGNYMELRVPIGALQTALNALDGFEDIGCPGFTNAGVCYDCTRWGLAEGGAQCALNRPEFTRKHCEQFEPLAF